MWEEPHRPEVHRLELQDVEPMWNRSGIGKPGVATIGVPKSEISVPPKSVVAVSQRTSLSPHLLYFPLILYFGGKLASPCTAREKDSEKRKACTSKVYTKFTTRKFRIGGGGAVRAGEGTIRIIVGSVSVRDRSMVIRTWLASSRRIVILFQEVVGKPVWEVWEALSRGDGTTCWTTFWRKRGESFFQTGLAKAIVILFQADRFPPQLYTFSIYFFRRSPLGGRSRATETRAPATLATTSKRTGQQPQPLRREIITKGRTARGQN